MRAVVDATVGGRGAPAPETFDFAPQSVTFSPPRYRWEAEGQLSGGLRGVRRRRYRRTCQVDTSAIANWVKFQIAK